MSDFPTCPECNGRKSNYNGRRCQECDGLGWTSRGEINKWYEREMANDAADAEYDRLRATEGW